MTSYETQLANDFARMNPTELVMRYRDKIKPQATIRGVVEALEKQGLLGKLVRDDWRDDGADRNGLYLIKNAELYEVFTGERGIKNWLETFDDLKSACTAWVDSAFNQLHHTAPDSKIR